jgi:hypothetical protein
VSSDFLVEEAGVPHSQFPRNKSQAPLTVASRLLKKPFLGGPASLGLDRLRVLALPAP